MRFTETHQFKTYEQALKYVDDKGLTLHENAEVFKDYNTWILNVYDDKE
jgi:hypothetical protein